MTGNKKAVSKALPPNFKAYGVTTRYPLPEVAPDWSEWSYTPKVEVWQACALSLNLEPNTGFFYYVGFALGLFKVGFASR